VPELKSLRQERFCLLYAVLGNASEAYRQAGYQTKNADVNAAQLMVRPSIVSRIAEINAQIAPKKVRNREGVIEWLDDLMSRPADEPVKWSDKLRAAEIICRMCGYNAPDQIELSAGSPLTRYLSDLRAEREVKAIEIEAETP
jgi:Terminase small subunit